jgi:hypothetical protein
MRPRDRDPEPDCDVSDGVAHLRYGLCAAGLHMLALGHRCGSSARWPVRDVVMSEVET